VEVIEQLKKATSAKTLPPSTST